MIAAFSKRWRKIASRVVTGKAGVRDRRYFEELADLLVGQEVRKFVEAAFGEPQGAEDCPSSVAGVTLCFEMREGFLDLEAWKESPPMLKAARDPEGRTRLVLVSIMNHRLRSCHVHGSVAGQNYVERLAQDPEALLRHVKLLDREGRKRLKQLYSSPEDRNKTSTSAKVRTEN